MKKIFGIILAICMTACICAPAFSEETAEQIVLYVSPTGNDANNGTYEEPMASMKRVKEYIKSLPLADKAKGVTVYFRGGEYQWEEMLEFTQEDSGTENGRIVYRNFPGETPIMSGGYKVDGQRFQKVSDNSVKSRLSSKAQRNVLVADLKAMGLYDKMGSVSRVQQDYFAKENPVGMEIFVNDSSYEMSRWPNRDKYGLSQFTTIKSVKVNANNWDLAVEVQGEPHWEEGDEQPVLEISDEAAERINSWKSTDDVHILGPVGWEFSECGCEVVNWDSKNKALTLNWAAEGGYRENGRFYFKNILEELDTPGEYYLDRAEGKFYIYPKEGENIGTADIHLSVFNDDYMIKMNKLSYVDFKGLKFRYSQVSGMTLNDVHDVSFNNCDFSDFGNKAVVINGKFITPSKTEKEYKLTNKNISISNCKFENMGNGAVDIISGNYYTLEDSNITVENCLFKNMCRIKTTYAPAVKVNGGGITIRNNTIDGSAGTLMQFTGYDNLVEYNEFANGLKETSDMGMIYGGMFPYVGTEIRYNYIHDTSEYVKKNDIKKSINVNGFKAPFRVGIYSDNGADAINVNHNIIENIPVGFMCVGSFSKFNNNIIVDCVESIFMRYNDRIQSNGWKEESLQYFFKMGLDKENSNSAWMEKFPETKEWYQYQVNRGIKQMIYPHSDYSNNFITYNKLLSYPFGYSPGIYTNILYGYSDAQKGESNLDNIQVSYYDPGFEDAKKSNFKLQADSELLKTMPGLADIDQTEMGYMPQFAKDILNKSVAAKIGNSEMYVNGVISGYSQNVNDAPIKNGDKIYMPLEATVKALGGIADGASVTFGENKFEVKDTINNNGIAYINLDEIKAFGKNVITDDDGVILIGDKAVSDKQEKLFKFLDILMR